MRCAVRNCGNNNRNQNRKKWRFFHFPKDKQQLQKWIEFCDRKILNTSTACICNEHFTPDDFERNMQYELGFTRKNPTKLKPGSSPTINGPQQKTVASKDEDRPRKAYQESQDEEEKCAEVETVENSDLIQFEHIYSNDLEDTDESLFIQDQNYELIEYMSEIEEYTKSIINDDKTHVAEMEVAIIDPLNPPSNAEDHVEIIGSESDNYTRHLENEVSSLKRQVFFLMDERKKMMDEIENLRATVRNPRLKHADALENRNTRIGLKYSNHRSPIKKTVMLCTANIDTIRKLRTINKMTN